MNLCKEKEPLKIANLINEEFKELTPKLELDTPWHGYVSLKNKNDEYEFRIGAIADKKERIIDWRHPIAKYYYQKLDIGELVELEPPYKTIQGAVSAYGKAEGYSGFLKCLEWNDLNGTAKIVRLEDGSFVDLNQKQENTISIAEKEQQVGLPDLISLLTPEQYELITQKTSEPLIIQGRAGSGKTSVALHRVAWLLWDDSEPFGINNKTRVLVVMFNKALQTFVSQSVKSLNLEDKIVINTFHSWAMSALEKVYRGQLEPISPKRVKALLEKNRIQENNQMRMVKFHAGFSQLMEEFVKAQGKQAWEFIEKFIHSYDTEGLRHKFKKNQIAYFQDLIEFKAELKNLILVEENELKKKNLEQMEIIIKKCYERSILYKEELLNLMTHWEWLVKFIPGLSEEDAKALGQRQKIIQTEDKAESAKVGKYIEFDDYALLLRLVQLKRGGIPSGVLGEDIFKFDHLVIDEAQDFGAMQLLVLLDSVNSRTGVTIVGDINQKIAPEKEFVGWDEVAKLLKIGNAKVTKLEVGHRSSLPIMWLADSVIHSPQILQGRDGNYPYIQSFSSYMHLKEHMVHFIINRMKEAPHAHICIVLRNKNAITKVTNDLSSLLRSKKIDVREGGRESFVFRKGVTVTNIHQIKGLEFDSVIIADASSQYWNDDIDTRRLMYVAITRAQENFIALCEGQPTKLLSVLEEKEFWKPVERFISEKTFQPVKISDEEIDAAFTISDLEL